MIHIVYEGIIIYLGEPMGYLKPKGTWIMKSESHSIVKILHNMERNVITSDQHMTR